MTEQMTWSAPMTAVAGATFTAAQFNSFVRDNLNECPAAKATTPGAIFSVSGVNQLAERIPDTASDTGSGTTTATTFAHLDGPAANGPTVTCITGTSALVWVQASCVNSSTGASRASFQVSGTSAVAAADASGVAVVGTSSMQMGTTHLVTGLTPGSNIFSMRYRVTGNTGTFSNRRIGVIPL